jgi:hypothetical protein
VLDNSAGFGFVFDFDFGTGFVREFAGGDVDLDLGVVGPYVLVLLVVAGVGKEVRVFALVLVYIMRMVWSFREHLVVVGIES